MKSKLIAAAAILMAVQSHSVLAQDAPAGAGDAAHGAIIFKQCLVCHTNVEGQNKIGPSLWAVVGRAFGIDPQLPVFHRYEERGQDLGRGHAQRVPDQATGYGARARR